LNNKKGIIITIAVIAIVASIITIPLITDQSAIAGSTKKLHFTKTITSTQDPGIGHKDNQLALILSPNNNTLYDGSVTFTASKPVQLVVLHKISPNEQKGQPTWTVDDNTIYGLSVIDPDSNAGSFEFTGSALGLRGEGSDEFSATVSVDGWIRGKATNIVIQKIEIKTEEPSLKLSRAHVPVTLPLHKGVYDGGELYYIITDTNDEEHAKSISERQNWKVELAPSLSNTPQDVIQKIYIFKNGLPGDGIYGYQDEVFSSTPEQTDEYSSLRSVTYVSWKVGQKPQILDSEEKVLEAKKASRVEFKENKDVILNMPQIIWPQGQMPVGKNKTIIDDMPYTGEQITDIDTEAQTVTFMAHRGWGPNGQTIYYIVTEAIPEGPAKMLGVTNIPTSTAFIKSPAASGLFQFTNGIKGTGPLGFQPVIADAAPGSDDYSPMWQVSIVEWIEPKDAQILQTKADIDALDSQGLIIVSIARPMNADHIINAPIIDPFQ
jgi:hypothetical protein